MALYKKTEDGLKEFCGGNWVHIQSSSPAGGELF